FDYTDWPIPTQLDQWAPYFGLFLALLLGLVALLVYAPFLGRLLACFLLLLLPTSTVFPRVERVNEARLYAALLPLVALVVVIVPRFGPRPRWVLAVLVVGCLLVLDMRRSSEFRSAITLWERTMQERPANPRAVVESARALARAGNLSAADERYQSL